MQNLPLLHLAPVFLALSPALATAAPMPAQGAGCAYQRAKLNGDSAGDQFGHSASVAANTALVGAPEDDDNGSNAGAVHVYARNGTDWVADGKIIAPDGAAGDRFGFSVSAEDDRVLVGAWQDDDKGSSSGSAYVFVRSGTKWVQQAKIVPADGASGDRFGGSVSLLGDRALIGAPRDDDNGTNSGSAYVFLWTGTAWEQETKILPSDGMAADEFGTSVSLSGNRALIGSPQDQPAGSAYVFLRSGTNWAEEDKVSAGTVNPDRFGESVSLSGSTALIGAPRDDMKAPDAGAAYVFVRTGTFWIPQATLRAERGAQNDELGESVSLDGLVAVVGARGDDDKANRAGAAYVFGRTGTTWSEDARLLAKDGAGSDYFGEAVAVHGDTAFLGASFDNNTAGTDAGAVYVFGPMGNAISTYCTSKTGLLCGIPVISYSGTPSASESTKFLIRAQPARSNKTGLFLYTDNGPNAVPFQGGFLCLQAAVRRSVPVSSGGTPGGCDGVFEIDWNAFSQGHLGGNPQAYLLDCGQRVNVQCWGRDTVATGSFLSNALEYYVCP